MKFIKNPRFFILIIIIGICILIFSVFDIIYDTNLIIGTFLAYALILLISIFFIYRNIHLGGNRYLSIKEFEKRLEGGLVHFKCPTCYGIFAIKKSKRNNKKYVRLTCPDCGALGVIPPNPLQIEEIIPEKKSIKANFTCDICGEGITIWAEGADLHSDISVYSCPFCGEKEPLKRY
jgi:predicted RNA-binding Zn-ribbon protein involved in translation (DUF1610 family)